MKDNNEKPKKDLENEIQTITVNGKMIRYTSKARDFINSRIEKKRKSCFSKTI